jgi:16S rRNA (uracil1498-N3)-methyltransferase
VQLFYQPGIPNGVHHLDPEESKHCIKVLRKKQHEVIHVVDGKGNFYRAMINDTNPKITGFEIVEQRREAPKNYYLHLLIAPTKRQERMEWLVEKATELGIDRISFITCERSERRSLRMERLERKAISAMKQSLKASLPQIDNLIPLIDSFSLFTPETNKYLAHLGEDSESLVSAAVPESISCILIGPEGDFTETELQQASAAGFKTVKLGNSRLRTETAALTAVITFAMLNS